MKHIALFAALGLTAMVAQASGNIEQGKVKAAAVCAACHGADGMPATATGYPRLAGQYHDYLEHALKEYKSGARKNAIMGPQAQALTPQEIANLAAYYASLPGLSVKK